MTIESRVRVLELQILKLPQIQNDLKWIKRIGFYLVGMVSALMAFTLERLLI